MDKIKQRDRVGGLVRLQLADQVQFDCVVRVVRAAQTGPFVLRFLHPVFAKHALSGGDQRRDLGRGAGLADRHQRDFAGRAPGQLGSGGDAGGYFEQGCGWIGHRVLL